MGDFLLSYAKIQNFYNTDNQIVRFISDNLRQSLFSEFQDMQKKNTYTLTKAEYQVMNILWAAGKSLNVYEVIEQFDEPKPAYTTISTFLRILINKKFVEYKKGRGKTHLYSPLISKAEYISQTIEEMKNNFFNGSASSFVKFFVEAEKISRSELEELIKLIEEE